MEETATARAQSGDVLLMIGTTKGAFLLRSDARRAAWELGGPHFAGEEVYALALDQRAGRPTLWAAPSSPWWGATLRRSEDLGASWSGREAIPLRFPEDSGLARQISPWIAGFAIGASGEVVGSVSLVEEPVPHVLVAVDRLLADLVQVHVQERRVDAVAAVQVHQRRVLHLDEELAVLVEQLGQAGDGWCAFSSSISW